MWDFQITMKIIIEKEYEVDDMNLTTCVYTICPCCGNKKRIKTVTRPFTKIELDTLEKRREELQKLLKEWEKDNL